MVGTLKKTRAECEALLEQVKTHKTLQKHKKTYENMKNLTKTSKN